MVERAYYVFKFDNTLCGVLRSFPVFFSTAQNKICERPLFVRNTPPNVRLCSDEAFC
jgi:hypothetical protein